MTLEIDFSSSFEGWRPYTGDLKHIQIDENKFWASITDERSGKIRLKSARDYFHPLIREDIHSLVEGFKAWRDTTEYLLMRDENVKTGKKEYFATKCSKRGNDVFASRLHKRLGFLKADEKFFDPNDFESHSNKQVKTKLIWITLTYDSKRCSLDEAWKNIASEFNLWITNLRNKYGKISYAFFPQAFPDPEGDAYSYPHLHGIVLFEDVEFNVFRRMEMNREGKLGLVYRVEEKHGIEEQGKWHSWIDIKALSSMRAVWNYAKKHCYNAGYGSSDEATLNNSVMWLQRKKSFNMSGTFRERYAEFIRGLRSSKVLVARTLDFSKEDGLGGVFEEHKFTCLGFFSVFDLCIEEKGPPWTVSVSEERVEKLMDRFKRRIS